MASDAFVAQLQSVLQFLQDNGFETAVQSVYQQLEGKQSVERNISPTGSHPARGDADQVDSIEEYRSKSAEPVLISR
jgi:hypothetical protein